MYIIYDYKISYNGDIDSHLDITKLKYLDLHGQIKYEKIMLNIIHNNVN
jgi:hypothetical protein